MVALWTWLSEHPEVLLFALIGVGMAVGHVSVRKVSLGAAAVLFVAIAVSASASAQGVPVEIPAPYAHLGLALFTFSVGVSRVRPSSTRCGPRRSPCWASPWRSSWAPWSPSPPARCSA